VTSLGFGPALVPGAAVRPRHARRPRVALPRELVARVVAAISGLRLRAVPSRRAVAGVALAVLLSAAFTGWRVLAARARADPVPATALASAAPLVANSGRAAPSASRGPSGQVVVVDVVGRVRHPGLVRLPAGSRVDDAVRAAGGALAGTDLSGLNLARVLVDGEQIAVGIAVRAPPPGSSESSGAGAGLINLNTATAEQLDALPGIGPVLAQRIVDWRTEHGRFVSVDQLRQVSGIGEAKFADIRGLVTV
jgi:competence protein ComEA